MVCGTKRFNRSYKPQTVIKAQALIDFIAKCIEPNEEAGSNQRANKH